MKNASHAKSAPRAALIVIGNEILSGRTVDKNINHMAKVLGEIGIRFMEVRVIPDVESTIIETVNEIRKKFDYVFTTGGIGPTHDDITTDSVAKAFGVPIVQSPEAMRRLSDYYKGELNEGRIKMAMLPEGAGIIDNPISTAPGFQLENVYVMAGIPNVMQAMMDSIKHGLKGGDVIIAREIVIYSSESKIATPLRELQERVPDVEIGSYPFVKDARLGVTLVLRSTDKNLLESTYNELEGILRGMGVEIEG